MTEGTTCPTGNVGATKVIVALVPGGLGDTAVMARPIRAGAPFCVTVQLRGSRAGLLGSEPLITAVPGAPENTVSGARLLTTGGRAALMVTVLVAVLLPQAFVAVSDKGTDVAANTTGAV